MSASNLNRTRGPAPPVSEPACISPVFVDELVSVTPDGAVTHLLFTVCQLSTYGGSKERVAQCRLVVPTDRLPQIGKDLLAGRLDLVVAGSQDGEPVSLQ